MGRRSGCCWRSAIRFWRKRKLAWIPVGTLTTEKSAMRRAPVEDSTLIEREKKNLERIEAKQRKDIQKMIEYEMRNQAIKARNEEKLEKARQREITRQMEVLEKKKLEDQAKAEREEMARQRELAKQAEE